MFSRSEATAGKYAKFSINKMDFFMKKLLFFMFLLSSVSLDPYQAFGYGECKILRKGNKSAFSPINNTNKVYMQRRFQ